MRSIVLLLLLVNVSVFAQKKKKGPESLLSEASEWFEGNILLTDGNELVGLIKYNDNDGVLSYRDGTDSKVFTSSRVMRFEFFDESHQAQRLFYAFPYEDPNTNVTRPQFFELIRDYKTFAILSRVAPLDLDRKTSTTTTTAGTFFDTRVVVYQTETIYLMTSEGVISPYFQCVHREEDYGMFGKDIRSSNKMVDKDLLQDFVAKPMYEKLIDYAEQNRLRFKVKAEFLKILEYYDTLIAR